jgi:hypothetical protein
MNAQIKVSTVQSVTDTETRLFDVDDVIEAIRTGGKKLKAQVTQIRNRFEAERDITGDLKAAKQAIDSLKKELPGVTWSGTFTQRATNKLVQHSGLLCADLDNLNGELPAVREKLKQGPYAYTVFTSPSGDGLKAVFRVPADASKHAGSFRAIEKHVSELTGKQIDQACKDPARLCFLSYDPDIYHNPNAIEIEPLPEPEKPQRVSNGEVNLTERQHIATEILGAIDWQNETEGYCTCPNQAAHTTGNSKRDCKVWLGSVPSIYCFHTSCRGVVEGLNETLRSRIAKAEAPAKTAVVSDRASRLLDRKPGTEQRHCALINLNTVSAKPVEWIEEPYLARGEMHFLQGQGGSYKGTLALTWAAEFSRRGEHVLLVLAEDDLAKKVKPLLMAAQADMGFVHAVTIRCGQNEDALVLPDDLDQLERAMTDTQAALVVIDPLLSHVSLNVDAYKDQHVKRVLTQIGKMAQRMNTVIVCVHHTKKDTSKGMKMAGMGSVAFYTTARVVLALAKLSEEEAVLEVVKSNIGAEGVRQLLRAEIIEVAAGISTPRLVRAGDSPVGVADALNGQREEKESKGKAAAKLMLDILEEEGQQKQSELFERVAKETGLRPGSVRRHAYFGILVEEDLVESRKDGFTGPRLVSRSERERPPNLRTVTPNRDKIPAHLHTCHTSGFYEGNLLKRDCHSSYISTRTVTSTNDVKKDCYASDLSALSATDELEEVGSV